VRERERDGKKPDGSRDLNMIYKIYLLHPCLQTFCIEVQEGLVFRENGIISCLDMQYSCTSIMCKCSQIH